MEATIDIIAFFIILGYSTVAFSLIYKTLPSYAGDYFSVCFSRSFKLNLGELDADQDSALGLIVFFIVSIINPIILLNLLISIMSDTFARVKEGKITADSRELANMILEVEGIMGWKRLKNDKFYLKLVCENNSLDIQDKSLTGKLKSLKDKVVDLINTVSSTETEIIKAIESTTQDIISSL